nr:uncharacterized protein LOC109164889 [Ipomoea batatas]
MIICNSTIFMFYKSLIYLVILFSPLLIWSSLFFSFVWLVHLVGCRLKNEAKKVGVQDTLAAPKFKIFSWAKWIIGSLLSIIFPFWNGILKIEGKVEEVVEEVEEVAEVVEKVATAAENVIEAVADKLPANTILKEAVEAVEHATAQVAEDARNVTVFIHKAEEVKQDIESLETMVEPLVDKIIEESKNNKVNNNL